MITANLDPVPARALAVGAHPDDIEFGAGGTLAKWAAAGCEVSHLVCTDGSKGSWDPDTDVARLVEMRKAEQQSAARALGGTGEVVFLGALDGELRSGQPLEEKLVEWIRRLRPAVVLGHDPWKRYRLHPDHRNAGFLLTDALVAARDPHFYRSQLRGAAALAPHRPDCLLLWEADEADHVEDITSTIDTKLAALMCHESQLLSTMAIDEPSAEDQVAAFHRRIRERASEHGVSAGIEFGEAFKRMDHL